MEIPGHIMDNSDADDEDGFEAQDRDQVEQLVQNTEFYRFVRHVGEEDYRLVRGSNLISTMDERTEAELGRSLHVEEDTILESHEDEGRENSLDEVSSRESISKWLSCCEQTENMAESCQGENQFWTTENQSNTSSSDFNCSVGMNFNVNNGSPNPDNEYAPFERLPRGQNTENSQRQMESPPSELRFASPSRSQQSATDKLTEVLSNRSQRRARSRSPDCQRTRARVETQSPDHRYNELLLRLHHNIAPEIFELPVMNEFEVFARFHQRELLRQQLTRPNLQSSHRFAASGTRSASQGEWSADTIGNDEVGGLRSNSPTTLFDHEARRLHPEEFSARDGIDSRTRLTSEIPNNTVTESDQGRVKNMCSCSEHGRVRPSSSTIIPFHRALTNSLNDTAFVTAPRRFRQLETEFGELSNFLPSDSDFEPSVSSSQNTEMGWSQTGSSDSEDGSSCDSNSSFDSCSSLMLYYSSSPPYLSSSFSSLISSSNSESTGTRSSSTENSESSSVLFEGSNEENSSSDSSSMTNQENLLRNLAASDESDSLSFPDVFQHFLVHEDDHEDNRDQSTGLTKQQINNLTVTSSCKDDTSKSCIICITKFTKGNTIRVLPCFHEYHAHCIDRWLSENTTCPICRQEVRDSDNKENSH
uniref:RING-type E3 ubiquitin transferase n=1 Tax=Oryctolagus cuniculus TaxID=9986 RepID=G1SUD5_RABIT